MTVPKILIVSEISRELNKPLADAYQVFAVEDAAMAIDLLFTERIDLVILDIDIPGQVGVKLLEIIQKYNTGTEIVMLISEDSKPLLVEAVQFGVFNFLYKPVAAEDLLEKIEALLSARLVKFENIVLRNKIQSQTYLGTFSGEGEYYDSVRLSIIESARLKEPVLIVGEAGTEKEIVAYEIYKNSNRNGGPFIIKYINSAAELEDISFLYDATNGYIVLADCAYLDREAQKRLKGLLNDNPVNVGVILFSSRLLRELTAAEEFDEELCRLLSQHEIFLVPLRDRIKDLPHLIEAYLKNLNSRYNFAIVGLTDETLLALSRYAWPGNLTELRNVLYLMANARQTGMLALEDLPLKIYQDPLLEEKFQKYLTRQQK